VGYKPNSATRCEGTVEKRASICASWLRRNGAFDGRPVTFRNLGFQIPGLIELHSDGQYWLETRTATGTSQVIGVSYRQGGIRAGLEALLHCPQCDSRRTKLYDSGAAQLICRKCCGLWYTCQRRSGSGRKAFLAQKIRMRLGGSAILSKQFPEKPLRMRTETYSHYKALGEFYEAKLSRRLKYRAPDYSVLLPR
jgi:hypothetical protein